MEVENKEILIMGVNVFRTNENYQIKIFKLSDEAIEKIIQRIKKFKNSRSKLYLKSLNELKSKAKTDENLMPYILSAVENGATLGEICDVLREIWGTYD
jgi:methylmalonyl-CoA mutase N-terminal domain/subunit